MSLSAYIYGNGTGRAKCMLCEQKITKDQKSIMVSGFRTQGQLHSNPCDCSKDRFTVEDMITTVARAAPAGDPSKRRKQR
jgi:hypothetical protein